jgi:hypothetical protein
MERFWETTGLFKIVDATLMSSASSFSVPQNDQVVLKRAV